MSESQSSPPPPAAARLPPSIISDSSVTSINSVSCALTTTHSFHSSHCTPNEQKVCNNGKSDFSPAKSILRKAKNKVAATVPKKVIMVSKVLSRRSPTGCKTQSKKRVLTTALKGNKKDLLEEGFEVHTSSDAISVSSDITNITGFSFSDHFPPGLRKTSSLMRGDSRALRPGSSMPTDICVAVEEPIGAASFDSSSSSVMSFGSPLAATPVSAGLKAAWVGEISPDSSCKNGLEPSLLQKQVSIKKLEMEDDDKSNRLVLLLQKTLHPRLPSFRSWRVMMQQLLTVGIAIVTLHQLSSTTTTLSCHYYYSDGDLVEEQEEAIAAIGRLLLEPFRLEHMRSILDDPAALLE